MQATMRKVSALLTKDFADAFKNPTMLLGIALPICLVLLYTSLLGTDDPEITAFLTPFYLSCGLCLSAGATGSMIVVYGIAEEREKNTLRTLMLANVSAGQILASRAVLALALALAVDAVCFFLVGGEKGGLAAYLGVGLLGSLPLVVLGLLVGLASRDQMTAGMSSLPLLLVAMAPIFSMYSENVANVVKWLPTGGMDTLVRLSVEGNLFTSDALQPLLITLAWIAVSAVAFVALFRRLSRDN